MTKKEIIGKAYENFANNNRNSGGIFTTKKINEEVQKQLPFKLNMAVSDFAQPETNYPRSKGNKELFVRIRRGQYIIK